MKHETIMALAEKWRKKAMELAEKNADLTFTPSRNLEIAAALQHCSADLLTAYTAELKGGHNE